MDFGQRNFLSASFFEPVLDLKEHSTVSWKGRPWPPFGWAAILLLSHKFLIMERHRQIKMYYSIFITSEKSSGLLKEAFYTDLAR
jgi:hypothetical protein